MVLLLIMIAIVNIVALWVPKRRTKIEMVTVGIFAILYAALSDVILVNHYQLYRYFAFHAVWRWMIPLLGLKAQMAVLFINYFPVPSRFMKKVMYILGWSVLSIAFEWVTVYMAGVLKYNGWTIWYSMLAYPMILTVIALVFYYVRHLLKENKWF